MASCLVPDFPAVMVALEHLKELDNLLKEEGVSFASEASLQLAGMTAAVTELESDRRVAHEHLEVETIENSKLRHQINKERERMSRDIVADVAAAQASNTEEIEQLHKELSTVSQLREATVIRQEALLSQNEALCPDREQGKAEHREIVATLNNQISLKYGLQMQLDQTQEKIEELRSCINAVEQDKITLEQNMVLERDTVTVKKGNLSSVENGTGEKIKRQRQAIRRRRRELERVNSKKLEAHGHLGELTADRTKLESNLQNLTASLGQFEKQLEGDTHNQKDLRQQREMLKKELCELGEVFNLAIWRLKENIATMESKIGEGQATRSLCQDHLTRIYEMFRQQHDEESEVRGEHFHISQQLEQSELQLAECIASVVKHNKEIKEMDKQIRELLEADTINKRMFERNQEKLFVNVDTEKKNIRQLEEEKSLLRRLLEEEKRKQEEHVVNRIAHISGTRRRYEELRREEAALQQRQPESADADMLMSHVTQCVATYRQIEIERHWEIEQCTVETEGITRSSEEKRMEAQGKRETLKEEEAKCNEEQSRHQRLKTITSKLRRRRTELELSIQGLSEKTSSLLQPREEMSVKLDEMRASRVGTLNKQSSELRAVEMSIYDTSVKLEQVSVENSRLRFCIRQMKEDVRRVGGNRDRYWQEIHQFDQDKRALFESLQEAWREDLLLTEDGQSSDGVLLACMSSLINHLKMRKQKLAHVNTLLHQQMFDFRERLGDKTTAEEQLS